MYLIMYVNNIYMIYNIIYIIYNIEHTNKKHNNYYNQGKKGNYSDN